MKQPPDWERIQDRMQPGELTRDGMLGDDPRTLPEIIDADDIAVRNLGLTHDDIANRMLSLQKAARERLGDVVVVDGDYEVQADETRGIIPCPFGHGGHYDKCVIFLKHLPTGREIRWTDLSIHLIRDHGFYQGRGAPFRLDPESLAALLHIKPHKESEQL